MDTEEESCYQVFEKVEAVLGRSFSRLSVPQFTALLKEIEKYDVDIGVKNGEYTISGRWSGIRDVHKYLRQITRGDQNQLHQHNLPSAGRLTASKVYGGMRAEQRYDTAAHRPTLENQSRRDAWAHGYKVADYNQNASATAGQSRFRAYAENDGDRYTRRNTETERSAEGWNLKGARKLSQRGTRDDCIGKDQFDPIDDPIADNLSKEAEGKLFNSKELMLDKDIWHYMSAKMTAQLLEVKSFGAKLWRRGLDTTTAIIVISSPEAVDECDLVSLVYDSLVQLSADIIGRVVVESFTYSVQIEDITDVVCRYIDSHFPTVLVKLEKGRTRNHFRFMGPSADVNKALTEFKRGVRIGCNSAGIPVELSEQVRRNPYGHTRRQVSKHVKQEEDQLGHAEAHCIEPKHVDQDNTQKYRSNQFNPKIKFRSNLEGPVSPLEEIVNQAVEKEQEGLEEAPISLEDKQLNKKTNKGMVSYMISSKDDTYDNRGEATGDQVTGVQINAFSINQTVDVDEDFDRFGNRPVYDKLADGFGEKRFNKASTYNDIRASKAKNQYVDTSSDIHEDRGADDIHVHDDKRTDNIHDSRRADDIHACDDTEANDIHARYNREANDMYNERRSYNIFEDRNPTGTYDNRDEYVNDDIRDNDVVDVVDERMNHEDNVEDSRPSVTDEDNDHAELPQISSPAKGTSDPRTIIRREESKENEKEIDIIQTVKSAQYSTPLYDDNDNTKCRDIWNEYQDDDDDDEDDDNGICYDDMFRTDDNEGQIRGCSPTKIHVQLENSEEMAQEGSDALNKEVKHFSEKDQQDSNQPAASNASHNDM